MNSRSREIRCGTLKFIRPKWHGESTFPDNKANRECYPKRISSPSGGFHAEQVGHRGAVVWWLAYAKYKSSKIKNFSSDHLPNTDESCRTYVRPKEQRRALKREQNKMLRDEPSLKS